jgi:hypothetical protein
VSLSHMLPPPAPTGSMDFGARWKAPGVFRRFEGFTTLPRTCARIGREMANPEAAKLWAPSLRLASGARLPIRSSAPRRAA